MHNTVYRIQPASPVRNSTAQKFPQVESDPGDNRIFVVKERISSGQQNYHDNVPQVNNRSQARSTTRLQPKPTVGTRPVQRHSPRFPWSAARSKKRKHATSLSSRSGTTSSTSTSTSGSTPSITTLGSRTLSSDLYSLLFLDTYDPLQPSIAPSSEQKHQINMLSSLDMFLNARLRQLDSVCGPIAVEGTSDSPTIVEAPFVKFWAVHNLLETGQLQAAFTALDEWCDLIQTTLKTQQPPLLSLLSVMSFEFHQLGKPEIADRVLDFLTKLAETYFGRRHPLSVMIWCLRASNLSDEVALPELTLERAVKKLSRMQHQHIALLIEDAKFRYSLVLRHRGRIEDSVEILRGMASDAEQTYGPLSPKTLEPLYTLARTYYDFGKNEQGKQAFESVLEQVGNAPGWHNDWLRTGSHGRLAQICKRMGYDLQARNHALYALEACVKLEDEAQQQSVWRARFEKDKIII